MGSRRRGQFSKAGSEHHADLFTELCLDWSLESFDGATNQRNGIEGNHNGYGSITKVSSTISIIDKGFQGLIA